MGLLRNGEFTGDETATVGSFAAAAESERRRGRYEEALRLGGEALDRSAGYSSAHLVVGRCLLEMGEVSRALEHLGRAVEIDDENGLAVKLLGDCLALGGFGEEARAAYERTRLLVGETEETRRALGMMMAGGWGLPEAVPAGKTAGSPGEQASEDADDVVLQGSEIELQGEFETATVARICEEQGILGTALKIYDSLRTRYPEDSLLVGKTAQLRRRIAETSPVPAPGRAGENDRGNGTAAGSGTEGAGVWTETS